MNRTFLTRTAIVTALAIGLGACSGGLFGGGDKKVPPTLGDRQPILSRIETGAKVDPALATVSIVLPPAQVNDSWAQAGGNAGKSYGHLALASDPSRAFTVDIEGASQRRRFGAAPVVGGGMLFAVGSDGVVSAFDAATGAARWSYNPGVESALRDSAFGGGVSYADGKVYMTDGVGDVAALDAASGSVVWKGALSARTIRRPRLPMAWPTCFDKTVGWRGVGRWAT